MAGELNDPGARDLVVVNRNTSDVSVPLGNGDGTFQVQPRFTAGDDPASVVLGDFNSGSFAAFAAVNEFGNDESPRFGLGNGTEYDHGRRWHRGD